MKGLIALTRAREIAVFVAVTAVLLTVYSLPPTVKESWKMNARTSLITWLASNYVHQDRTTCLEI